MRTSIIIGVLILIISSLVFVIATQKDNPGQEESPTKSNGPSDAQEINPNAPDLVEETGKTNTSQTPASLKIDLSNQGLIKVPSYIFEKTKAHELDLSNNTLTGSLPAEIHNLSELRILNLSDNQFSGVPAEVGQLRNLEILDLSNNKLTGLPYELGNLTNLKRLNLRGNNYAKADLDLIKKSLPSETQIIID